MLAYTLIMFATAALFVAVGAAIYRGNLSLIHDYHQKNVKESERGAYGRAIAKGLFILAAALCLSGIIALAGAMGVSVAALFIGSAVSIAVLIRVQRKYNGGIF
ncbi:MAG: hypothetical protein IKO07_11415 [Clostridia bacterium]|nr:hypothetical protein [Clostridia bacterium]